MTERIRISGHVDAAGHLTLRPAFPTTIPPGRQRQDAPSYAAEILDINGRALTRVSLKSSRTCGVDSIALRGSVDLPTEAKSLEILQIDASGREPIVLASVPVPDHAPELRLLDAPEGNADGKFKIEWEAKGDPPPVRYFVDYSPRSGFWEPLSLGLNAPHFIVDFANLAGGDECRIAVTASNGVRSSRVESEPFHVSDKPCAAAIMQPVDGTTISPNAVLVGNGWWREERKPEVEALRWTSDIQGELGRGRLVETHLKSGTHRITLHAGREGRVGEESVTIHVA